MARAIDANELEMFPYAEVAGTEEQIADWIEQVGLSGDDTASRARNLCWKVIEGFINVVKTQPTLTPPNEPLSPYPDGDTSILACPRCGSGEYLYNEDGAWNNYCGQCGQRIGWVILTDRRPPEGET